MAGVGGDNTKDNISGKVASTLPVTEGEEGNPRLGSHCSMNKCEVVCVLGRLRNT